MKRAILSICITLCAAAWLAAQPKIVSHRGFYVAGESYENTISSLENAQKLGVYGVEFDVNLTSDGHLVILHGPFVPGTKINAQKSRYDDIRAVTLPGGHQVPNLSEWLEQGKKDPSCKLIMELKKHSTPERETLLVEKTMKEVRESGIELDQIEFISFSLHILREVKRLEPAAFTCYVSSSTRAESPGQLHDMGIDALSYELNVLMNFPEMADEANSLGMPTTLWMVEDPELIDWAWKHGITYISTDFPDKAKAYIEAVAAFKAKDKKTYMER